MPAATTPPALPTDVGFSSAITVNPAVRAAPNLVRDGTNDVPANATQAGFTVNNTAAGGTAGFSTLIGTILNYSLGTNIGPTTPNAPFATTGLGPLGTLSTPFTSPTTLGAYANLVVAGQSADTANAALTGAQAYQTSPVRPDLRPVRRQCRSADGADDPAAEFVPGQCPHHASHPDDVHRLDD